jgi:hypothetical protein
MTTGTGRSEMNFMGEEISGGEEIRFPVPPKGGFKEGHGIKRKAPSSMEKIRHLQGFGYDMHLRALSSGKVYTPEGFGTGGPD